MPEAMRHLHVIDGSTGEVLPDGCPMCAAKDDVIAGLERDIRGWASRYAILKREKDQQAKEDPLWPILEALYGVWRRECGHMKSRFSTDDFWVAQAHFERYGWDGLETAIAGAKFDCWRTKRRNGSMKRHDDWAKNIFKDRASVEEFMKRAPEGFVPAGLPARFASAEQGKVEPPQSAPAPLTRPGADTRSEPDVR